ncbi:hypothetical protein [Streptomyces sp. NPDC017673]|uniref:hypothetical protein n=1 Tax=unclassified Streptomyces TaxID=2593676 RepID=UPI0037A5EAC1
MSSIDLKTSAEGTKDTDSPPDSSANGWRLTAAKGNYPRPPLHALVEVNGTR